MMILINNQTKREKYQTFLTIASEKLDALIRFEINIIPQEL